MWGAMKRSLLILSLVGFLSPASASEAPPRPVESADRVPMSWVPIMAAVYKDFKDGGIDAECHTLGVLPHQTVTVGGVRHEDVFLVGVARSQAYYQAASVNDYMTRYRCGRSYQYYIDKEGKVISRTARRD